MSDPTISVVMSVYNGENYLREAIESILNQTYSDYEFIIIDDGSTDNTWTIVSEYIQKDPRIIPTRFFDNRGTSVALNEGLLLSKGEFIARQDSDDISLPDRLSQQLMFLQSNLAIGAVAAAVWRTTCEGVPFEVDYTINGSDEIQHQLLDRMCLCGPTLMVRRSSFEEAGFYFSEDMSFTEDYDLCLRISDVSKISNIITPLYYYRQWPDSVSHKRRFDQLCKKALALERAIYRKLGPIPPQEKFSNVARDYFRAALVGFLGGETTGARDCLIRAEFFNPDLLKSTNLIEPIIDKYISRYNGDLAIEKAQSIFAALLPNNPLLSRLKKQVISRLYMQRVYSLLSENPETNVRHQLYEAIQNNHKLIVNRGVLSLILSQITTNWLRVIFPKIGGPQNHDPDQFVE